MMGQSKNQNKHRVCVLSGRGIGHSQTREIDSKPESDKHCREKLTKKGGNFILEVVDGLDLPANVTLRQRLQGRALIIY